MKLARLLVGVVVSLVIVVALAFGVFPTRAWLDQREELAVSSRRATVLEDSTAALQQRVDRLRTDGEIERLAREQHNLTLPGEEAFALLPTPSDAVTPISTPKPVVTPKSETSRGFWERLGQRLNFWD